MVWQNDSITNIEGQQSKEQDSDEVEESWILIDKMYLLQPKIEKFHACLSPYFMNGDHIYEAFNGMIVGSKGRKYYIES